MKQTIRSVIINQPASVVFEFAINPKNTDTWFKGTGVETVNEWLPKFGSIYKNQWGVLQVTAYIQDKIFQLSR